MFTLRVTVPRITHAQIAEFEATVPGFSTVATVPVIETEEQAVRVATTISEKRLTSREYISDRKPEVTKTDSGWNIAFICGGD
jgi:hypothetical protein